MNSSSVIRWPWSAGPMRRVTVVGTVVRHEAVELRDRRCMAHRGDSFPCRSSTLPGSGHLRGLPLVDLGVVVLVEALVDDLAPVGGKVELGGVVPIVAAEAE